MPQGTRPNEKAMLIAYKVLKVPKEMQQQTEPRPSERLIKEWVRDSSMAQ